MILNALHQLGAPSHEDLPARWAQAVAAANEQRSARSLPPIELREVGATVAAYVNHGRWVADCLCNGGMAVSPEYPQCACLDCGRVYDVAVPDAKAIDAATVLLERRPEPFRNWRPAIEAVAVLQAENAAHGLDPACNVSFDETAALLAATKRHNAGQALMQGEMRRAIEAGGIGIEKALKVGR